MSLSEELIAAAKSGNVKEVRKLLDRRAPFTKDQFGNTALHEAAWNGNNDIVKVLLNKFCFVDCINNTGFTPLLLASQNGHAKVVKTLLKWEADPLLINQHGETAMHLVAKYDHANVIQALAAFKVNMDARGKDDNTALHIAAKLGNTETIKALLQAGADASLTNSRGLQPLECAELGGHKEAAKLLRSVTQKSKPRMRSATMLETTRKEVRSKTPPEKQSNHLQHERMRPQRTMSVSVKFPFRPSRDLRAAVNKKKMKNAHPADQAVRSPVLGSPKAMSPASRSVSREELDCAHTHSRSISPTGGTATIDQLLNEMEREYHGPGYKYTPKDDPLGEREVCPAGTRLPSDTRTPAKSFLRSTRDGQISKDNYDILEPPGPSDHYDYLVPPSRMAKLCPKHHTYETLLPKDGGEDGDTYVYMAPLKNFLPNGSLAEGESTDDSFHEEISDSKSSELSPEKSDGKTSEVSLEKPDSKSSEMSPEKSSSKGPKRAIICSAPIEANARHEPNSITEPRKGILTQPSTESEGQSQLERYLQDELDTMRQAFQIRLSQLEKRYQRQLILEQRKNGTNGVFQVRLRKKLNPLQQNTTKRRGSWHSQSPERETDKPASPEQRSGSSLGLQSDSSIDESDIEPCEDLQHSKPKQEGLRGGARTWRDDSDDHSPRMSPVRGYEDEDDETLTEEDKGLIQEKTQQYRQKMTKYFKEKSESQIASVEKQYRAQMSELERKCEERATERLGHLKSRIRDLESRLVVQTLV